MLRRIYKPSPSFTQPFYQRRWTSIKRCFVPVLPSQDKFSISGQEHKHIKAHRLQPGDLLELFDSSGSFCKASILNVERDHTVVQIIQQKIEEKNPYAIAISLAVSLTKGERTDDLIEKIVELGVSNIIPVVTKRSIFIPKIENETRFSRWNKKILEASKQSLCPVIPQLQPPTNLDVLLSQKAHDLILWGCMPSEAAQYGARPIQVAIRSVLEHSQSGLTERKQPKILALIGPEGDFDSSEKEKLFECGGLAVTLGQNRLRTETAAITIVSNIWTAFESYLP